MGWVGPAPQAASTPSLHSGPGPGRLHQTSRSRRRPPFLGLVSTETSLQALKSLLVEGVAPSECFYAEI